MPMQRGTAYVIGAFSILLAIAWQVYPIYPTTTTLCDMLNATYSASSPLIAEWQMRSHTGAIVRLQGTLMRYGTSEYYGIESPCGRGSMDSMLEVPRSALMSSETRGRLARTTSDESTMMQMPVTAYVRVKALGPGGCFSPGVVVTALAIESRGEPRPRPVPVR